MEKEIFKFEMTVDNENYILRDHRVHGVRTMPGVTFLDLIFRGLIDKDIAPETVELNNVVFREPIITTHEFDRQLEIAIEKSDNRGFIEGKSRKLFGKAPPEDRWDLNFQAEFNLKPLDFKKRIDVEKLIKNSTSKIDLDESYNFARSVNISHLEFMKGLGEIYRGEGYMLAKVNLSDFARDYLDNFFLHPALLDCSTIVPFLYLGNESLGGKPYIPMFIESFCACSRFEENCHVYIEEKNIIPTASRDLIHFNIEIFDKNGNLSACFNKLTTKKIRSKELITVLEEKQTSQEKETYVSVAQTFHENDEELSLESRVFHDLKKMIAEMISKSPDEISEEDGFYEQGLDSKNLLELVKKLEKKLGAELYPTLLFEYSNINELGKYLIEHFSEKYPADAGIGNIKSQLRENPDVSDDGRYSNENEIRSVDKAEHSRKNSRKTSGRQNEIAIIGVAGRYPMADDLDEFWDNLANGKDCITEIPADRWDNSLFFNPEKDSAGTIYSKWGGFISDVDKFDSKFFNISQREAQILDPQERLFLETSWSTVEDAGYTRKKLEGKKVGVFVGVMWGQYQLIAENMNKKDATASSIYSSIANRVSYTMNFIGPSMSVDTMCSSSLTAIHLACDSIRKGESQLAIAGGVNLSIHPSKYLYLSQQKFLSTDGRCRSFGEGGDGYVPGEGVGAVLLKELERAIEDGDHIYVIIKSSALNHGGKASGFTVPSPSAQAEVISSALKKADIDPRTLSYIESHGTGTSLGDPVEISGLVKSFEEYTKDKQFCSIGSLKSNIGHLESAAGIAALTKLILQLKYKKIVPSIHSRRLNPSIDFKNSPFYVQKELDEWKSTVIVSDGRETVVPRRAGISSFGAGGSNAHVIVEEYPENDLSLKPQNESRSNCLIVLSAKNRGRLLASCDRLSRFLDRNGKTLSIADISYNLSIGREPMEERVAFIASGIFELKNLLSDFSSGKQNPNILHGNAKRDKTSLKNLDIKNGEIEILIRDRKFDRLGRLWVYGMEFSWEELYNGLSNRKIPLPAYPFERERCWLSGSSMSEKAKTILTRSLHPLLGENVSSFMEQKFSTKFSGDEFFLKDHI
ncbi:MAG: polyketide synthase dehydratase domain-containing protein, partial [Oligoflexales bacterium]|nr:polyketide synthase dehydratase domain-containing protein [Oligoflexales bacterium]